jgi:processive 1,2-diacylglycerol beta-glucosyltransferase
MRILFLSVTAGQGHNQTAKGIMQRMSERGHTCKLLDTFDYIEPVFGEAVDKGYRMTVAHTPKVFGKAFSMMEKAEQNIPLTVKMNQKLSDHLSKELFDVYESFRPNVVVSSHSCAAQISSSVYCMGVCAAPRIGIVTDYTLHPYWKGANLDALVTPSEQLTYYIAQAGMPERIIRPIGIPINPKFNRAIGKKEAREQAGLPDLPTVLIMGGSMGHGDVTTTIERLDRLPIDFQMVVVCGSNEKLKNRLDALLTVKRLTVLGFSTVVDVLMSAADLIVTKPGGLTVSEAIAKKLPMVLIDPIPGQEDRNMDFLTNHGMAMRTGKHLPVDVVVWQLLTSEARLQLMRAAQEAFGKPNATDDLQELIESYDPKNPA